MCHNRFLSGQTMVIYSNQDDDETQKTVSDIKKNQSGKACETTCDVRQTEVSM